MDTADLPPQLGTPAEPPVRRHRRRRRLLLTTIALVLVVVAAGIAVLTSRQLDRDKPLVIDQAHAVIWGRTLTRPIEIAADDVTVRRTTIRTDAPAAIQVRPGVAGAVITDTEIHCTGRATDGIVPGDYSALRVSTHGCRQSFVQNADSATVVVDSEEDGQVYSTDEPVGIGLPADSPEQPEAPLPHRAQRPVTGPKPLTSWPGATTTGVPAGTALTNSGSLDLRRAGQVITNLNINGCVAVRAPNVTIRKSRITCALPTYAIRGYETATNLVVEDVEINGGGRNSAAVCCSGYTLRRVNVYNVIDGPRLGSRTTIVDSWVHDLVRVPSSHNDALQTTGGSMIVVRHNRLDAYRLSTNDPMNACVMIGSTTEDAVRDLLIEQNYCDGGNYSIGIRSDVVAANIVVRNNTFGRHCRYGVVAGYAQAGILWDKATNTWFDNGEAVVR